MKRSSLRHAALPAAVALSLGLAACGGDDNGDDTAAGGDATAAGDGGGELSGTVNGAGASSQEAAMSAWIAGFIEANPDATVNYDPVGSGGGREQFGAGAVDFAGTDAYLDDEEVAAAEEACGGAGFVEFPGYISPIAVAFNVPGIDALNMSPATIAQIFDQEITNWNDPAIAEDNPDVELPDLPITPVNRSDESGTTENFVDYLAQAAPEEWTYEVSGDWPVAGGESAQGTSGVVGATTNAEGGITYADASQVGELGVVAVEVADGEYVEYSPEAAAAVVDASERVEGRPEFSFAYDIVRTPQQDVYPIALVSYQVACVEYEDQATADLVRGLFTYIISEEGQQSAAENAGSAPISDALREQGQTAIDAITAAG